MYGSRFQGRPLATSATTRPASAIARTAILAAATLLLTGTAPKTVSWNTTVALTAEGGHLVGNPTAAVKLVEYVSYTCPQCAAFMIQSAGALQIGYISSGKVSVEVRHLIQAPVDLAAAMLANCGPTGKFALNHAALMRSQATWRAILTQAGAAQKQRWVMGALVTRNRAIAGDLHWFEIMEARGFDRIATEKCLGDSTVANRIGEQSKAGYASGITRAPSFTINGTLLKSVHTWPELRAQIDASL